MYEGVICIPRYLNELVRQLNGNRSLIVDIKAGGILMGRAEHLDKFTLKVKAIRS